VPSPPEPEFRWDISTILDGETGQPYVGLSIWYRLQEDEPSKLMATWKWGIQEARQRGFQIQQAAEASESDAHLIMTLRERKMPEPEIQEILERIRKGRGKV